MTVILREVGVENLAVERMRRTSLVRSHRMEQKRSEKASLSVHVVCLGVGDSNRDGVGFL